MKVGFIGLGRMGKPMAVNIFNAGFDLTVFDVRKDPVDELVSLGAKPAQTARQLGEHAEIIGIAVVDDSQVEEVVLGRTGLLEGASSGAIIAIHSTILPKTVLTIAECAREAGVHVIDSPISGGEEGARERNLCCMVGGDQELVDRCRGVFASYASQVVHMGELGSGAAAKLIAQAVVCINMLAASEAELLCRQTGLRLELMQQVLGASSGQSFVIDHWMDRFKRPADPDAIRRRRTAVFKQSLAPALDLASSRGVSLPGAVLAHRLFDRIMGLEETDEVETSEEVKSTDG
jgi:3-hydroxyisobutyrate dehydrogenase